jgi:hypothetical protein
MVVVDIRKLKNVKLQNLTTLQHFLFIKVAEYSFFH